MRKKKILFLMPNIGCGGVETTLFSLWDAMDRQKYDITLLLLEKKGVFLHKIPEDIKIRTIQIPEKEYGIFFGKKSELKRIIANGKIWIIPSYILYVSQNRITENRTKTAAYFDRIEDTIPVLDGEYDLAIDYFGYATFTTFYLAEKVKARLKVSWVHSVFSRFSPQAFAPWYRKMDVIFAVSQMVKSDFESIFPDIRTVDLFYNVKDPKVVLRAAEEAGGFDDGFMGKRILTVGRVCYEKGVDIAAEAFDRLIQENYDIKWYVIGNVEEEEKIKVQSALKTEKAKERFVFLGIKSNPFPYMKQCDIYVQTSRYEGYCTTTNEARILGKPIVMTDVSGSREQIEDGINGLIVDSTVDGIYKGVKKMLDEPELRRTFTERLMLVDCDTHSEVKKLEALLEDEHE